MQYTIYYQYSGVHIYIYIYIYRERERERERVYAPQSNISHEEV